MRYHTVSTCKRTEENKIGLIKPGTQYLTSHNNDCNSVRIKAQAVASRIPISYSFLSGYVNTWISEEGKLQKPAYHTLPVSRRNSFWLFKGSRAKATKSSTKVT